MTHPNFVVSFAAVADEIAHDALIATVSIDRPDKRNALTVDMWRQLTVICAELAAEPRLRAVVVTGSGPSFCAGADISALAEDDAVMKAAVYEAEEALRALPVPTIARISGHCFGGGNQLAVACDLRVADATAVFAIPPAKLSVVYPLNSTRALVALVGPSAAKRFVFTAGAIDAREALRIGLVDEVVEPAELVDAVDALVASMLPLAPLTQAATKELVNGIVDGTATDASYDRWYEVWRASEDGIEGPQAFLERRPARFRWQRHEPRR